jgi:3-dehydroquinate synthetase
MGTIAADRVSLARGWMSEEKVSRIEKILFPIIKIDKNALYTKLDSILDAMHKDKKQTGKSLTAVLMQEIGDKMMLNVIHDLNSDEVRESVLKKLKDCVKILEDEKDKRPPVVCCEMVR